MQFKTSSTLNRASKLSFTLFLVSGLLCGPYAAAEDYYVDPISGSDAGPGTYGSPYRTVSAVLAQLPEVVTTYVAIHLAPGIYTNTGAHGMPSGTLVLDRKMRRTSDWLLDVSVHFLGEAAGFQGPAQPGEVILDWGATPLVQVNEGTWYFENVQLGNRSYPGTQQGIEAYGSGALVHLKNVRIHTGSQSGAGILASREAEVRLYGAIELNEDLHDTALENSFCGIVAEYHGAVRFRDAGSLSLGNGSLGAGYFGTIELGGRTARITSWAHQANCLAINNSGRIDLHGTEVTLCAKYPANALIGLEDDGNILAENAQINLQTSASVPGNVVLQKSSKLYGGPFVVSGGGSAVFSTMSGSTLVGTVNGPIERVSADTGSYCYLRCSAQPATVTQQRHGTVDIELTGDLADRQKQITSVNVDPSGTLTLEWRNVGLFYTVERTTNLVDNAWAPAPGTWPILENQWSESIPSQSEPLFYRIRYQ